MSTMYLALTSLPSDSLELRVVIGSCIIGKTLLRGHGPLCCETGTIRVGNVVDVICFIDTLMLKALTCIYFYSLIRLLGAYAFHTNNRAVIRQTFWMCSNINMNIA